MPGNYADQLTPEEIDTLVQYLLGTAEQLEAVALRRDGSRLYRAL